MFSEKSPRNPGLLAGRGDRSASGGVRAVEFAEGDASRRRMLDNTWRFDSRDDVASPGHNPFDSHDLADLLGVANSVLKRENHSVGAQARLDLIGHRFGVVTLDGEKDQVDESCLCWYLHRARCHM